MKDSFYTPDYLAELLVSYANYTTVKSVADFCVGEGELLKAASKKWPKAKLYGTDISLSAIEKLNKEKSNWKVEYCDFVDGCSREECSIFKLKFEIILLNPPFTCKGATIIDVKFDNIEFKISTAMLFLITSIQYLKKDGHIYAILPQSVAYSEKDADIWKYLTEYYGLEILEERNNKDFRKCAPNTILVYLTTKRAKKATCSNIYSPIRTVLPIPNKIIRGNISMHLKDKYMAGSHKIPLVHTTNLIDNTISNLEYFIGRELSIVTGPALLIPRVGNFNSSKIVVVLPNEVYSLSDCIIAFQYNDINSCVELFSYINENWDLFIRIYKGTGAKYITLKRIKEFFGFSKL